MIFLDSETCGLHGMAVLLQYAKDDGDIILYDLWKHPVSETLMILESIAEEEVCGFNLAFDWFHLQKLYCVFSLFQDRFGDLVPMDHIDDVASCEKDARTYDACLKPKAAMDLMLFSRKGPWQSLMARKQIRIRRVPSILTSKVKTLLEQKIILDDIYFSRKSDIKERWKIFPCEDNPQFSDIVLSFAPSGALKVLAEHVLGVKNTDKFTEVDPDKKLRPHEVGWAPFAHSSPEKNWRVKVKKDNKERDVLEWPALIKHHIDHWAFYERARTYAKNDVVYTRDLWKEFGCPEAGDDDSELACMVGSVRWRGFKIDTKRLAILKSKELIKIANVPLSPNAAKKYISEVMDEIEIQSFESTKRVALEEIAKWECDCVLEDRVCDCGGHPAAKRAEEVLEARKSKKKVEVYDKLIKAGRFHASFKVIGTKSSRMSGTDGLNAQGIDHSELTRDCFELADDDFQLDGGDFESFEVVLAEAAYDDPELRRELTELKPCFNCHGDGKINGEECEECGGVGKTKYKIHGLFGMDLSGLTYAEVAASKGSDPDWYSIGKSGVFAMIYGGNWETLVNKQGIDEEIAQKAESKFLKRFPGIMREREKIDKAFCSMRQPGGIGSKIEWDEPEDYIESLFGFRRYFTLENMICKELFEIAQKPPKLWQECKIRVTRRDREQSAAAATMSAIFATCFHIQASNMRAAANHVIQSSGATITKRVQRRIWDIQPAGRNRWRVAPMNVHDEIACPALPEYSDTVADTVHETVEGFREQVPLIEIDWVRNASSWATMK